MKQWKYVFTVAVAAGLGWAAPAVAGDCTSEQAVCWMTEWGQTENGCSQAECDAFEAYCARSYSEPQACYTVQLAHAFRWGPGYGSDLPLIRWSSAPVVSGSGRRSLGSQQWRWACHRCRCWPACFAGRL